MSFSEKVGSLLFGPKIEGVVSRVAPDSRSRNLVHVLMSTPQGERHVIHPRSELGLNLRTGDVEIHDFSQLRPGEQISLRVRGKGVLLFPWSKVDRNPFGTNLEYVK